MQYPARSDPSGAGVELLTISDNVLKVFSDEQWSRFVDRCIAFLDQQRLIDGKPRETLDPWMQERCAQCSKAGLTSERSLMLVLATEARAGHNPLADPQVVQNFERLAMRDDVRCDWLRGYLGQSPAWHAALERR